MKYVLRTLAVALVISAFSIPIASQVFASSYNNNNIIDDSVFNNSSAMNGGQINNWLNSNFPNSCISLNNGFSAPDPTGYSPSTGYTYGVNVSAGQVISDVSLAYGINPQVILATLEKESSVVTGNASYHCQYMNTSMGYGCPDSGSCPTNPATMSGFSKQVVHAAWLFKFGQQRALGNTGWNVQATNYPQNGDVWNNSDDPPSCYGGPMTQGNLSRGCGQPVTYYDGYGTIDGTTVHMDTGATASLYWYTPHFHGNQNFFSIFSQWFGTTHNEVIVAQANGVDGLWAVYGGMRQLITSPAAEKAWGLFNLTPVTMEANALNTLPQRSTPLTILARNPLSSTSNPVYMLADQGGTYDALPSVVQDWGLSTSSASEIGPELVSFTQRLGNLSGLVATADTQGIYLMDGGTLHGIASPTILNAWGGSSPTVISISNALFSSFTNSGLISNNQAMSGGTGLFMDNGVAYRLPGILNQVYPHNSQTTISSALLNAMPNGGNTSRFISSPGVPGIFMVDNGQRMVLASPSIMSSYHASGESNAVTALSTAGINSFATGQGITTRFIYNTSTPSQAYFLNNTLRTLSDQFTSVNNYGVGLSPTTLSYLGSASGALCSNDFISGNSGNSGIYLMDGGNKRPVSNYVEYQLLNANPAQECELPQEDFDKVPSGSIITPLVSNGSTNYLLDNGHRYAVTGTSQWQLANFVPLGSGALAKYADGGTLSNTIKMNGAYTVITDRKFYTTTNATAAALWGSDYSQSHSGYVISYLQGSGSLSQFASSNNANHGGIYLVDQGKFILLANPDTFFNAGYTNQNIVGVNDAYLTANANGTWQGYAASESGTSNIYILEGGNKHLLPSNQQTKWLGSPQTVTPTTLSTGLLSLLTTGPTVTNSFASPNVPGIFAMTNAQKFVIPNYTTYSQSYAPFLQTTNHLINAIPSQ